MRQALLVIIVAAMTCVALTAALINVVGSLAFSAPIPTLSFMTRGRVECQTAPSHQTCSLSTRGGQIEVMELGTFEAVSLSLRSLSGELLWRAERNLPARQERLWLSVPDEFFAFAGARGNTCTLEVVGMTRGVSYSIVEDYRISVE